MRITGHILLLLLTVLALFACGGDEPPTVPDQAAFDTAVERYLDGKSMDLAIDEYRTFELAEDGSAATAIIALTHAGEGYANLRVRYEFAFEKVSDRWQVTSHRQVKE